jgi:hypothetical protein
MSLYWLKNKILRASPLFYHIISMMIEFIVFFYQKIYHIHICSSMCTSSSRAELVNIQQQFSILVQQGIFGGQ